MENAFLPTSLWPERACDPKAEGPVSMPRMSLVDILIGTTSLTPEQLLRAEELSTQKGVRLEEVLVQQRFLSEEELLQAQGQQLGMPYWKELPESEFDISLMTQI